MTRAPSAAGCNHVIDARCLVSGFAGFAHRARPSRWVALLFVTGGLTRARIPTHTAHQPELDTIATRLWHVHDGVDVGGGVAPSLGGAVPHEPTLCLAGSRGMGAPVAIAARETPGIADTGQLASHPTHLGGDSRKLVDGEGESDRRVRVGMNGVGVVARLGDAHADHLDPEFLLCCG